MRLPCEDIVNEVLPAVRSLVAKRLHEHGYSQTEIAELLDLTQPAVSQYLDASRGKNVRRIEQDPSAAQKLDRLVTSLMMEADDETVSRQLHDVCVAAIDDDHGCPYCADQ